MNFIVVPEIVKKMNRFFSVKMNFFVLPLENLYITKDEIMH